MKFSSPAPAGLFLHRPPPLHNKRHDLLVVLVLDYQEGPRLDSNYVGLRKLHAHGVDPVLLEEHNAVNRAVLAPEENAR